MESYVLPPLYSGWITELLGVSVSGESRTTCDDCPMCKKLEPQSPSDIQFTASTKCCTYFPTLPNYLVGGVLQDNDPSFQHNRSIFEKGALRGVITPWGIQARDIHAILYRMKQFGQIESLVCPYYINRDGGLCGIWRYRNSRCSTWFCKYDRGRTGHKFWKAVEEFLAAIEEYLTKWCIQQLEVGVQPGPHDTWEEVWGNWIGREREFYIHCFDLIGDRSLQDVLNMAGQEIHTLSQDVMHLFRGLQKVVLPESLQVGEFRSENLGNGSFRLWGYSNYDSIDIPESIMEILPYFDGSSVQSVLARIREREGILIESDLLQRLHDFRILVVTDPATTGTSYDYPAVNLR